MPPSRSILLVAYFYPPCRDTGARRPASMARHLAELGHRVTVLTTSAYSGRVGPGATTLGEQSVIHSRDLQLVRAKLAGKPTATALFDGESYRGKAHPISRWIAPEPLRVAWAPFAGAAARKFEPDCVITTSPPESAHRIGYRLRRRGVPWVADLRDAWTFEPLRDPFATALHHRYDERLERRWLGSADTVVCVSEPAAADLRRRGIADPIVIANGWDPAESPDALHPGGAALDRAEFDAADLLSPQRVSLVYTGRFGSYGRDPKALIEAMARLAGSDPAAAGKLELAIAGPLTAAEQSLFQTDVAPARINRLGSLERSRALALQRSADALLLVAAPARSQLINFKLFEYLASGTPILALAAGTEAGRVAAEAGCEVVDAGDPTAITAALAKLVAGELSAPRRGAVDPYTYPRQAERMAEAVELAIARAGG